MTASLETSCGAPVEYKALPKNIGDVPSPLLLDIARQYAARAENLSPEAATKLNATAGSAYVEATIAPNDMSVDSRLACLDEAEKYLQSALEGERGLAENGFEQSDPTSWLRAQLQCDFMDVYRDIACGEVTARTTEEITEKIRTMKQTLERSGLLGSDDGIDQPREAKRAARGLHGELVVLLRIWEDYARGGASIAFPATVRGDSGEYLPEETHDIVFAWQKEDDSWEFSGAEIKSGDGRTIHAFTRYHNTIVFVGHNGDVRVFDPVPPAASHKP